VYGRGEAYTGFWWGNLRKRDHLGDGFSGSGMWGYEFDQAGSGQGRVSGTCECGNEPSGFIKCEDFLY
jgi:hypothetical protein